MLFNPLMPYLHPRNSGLIAFKGGGGEAASGAAASGVAAAASTGSNAASDTGTASTQSASGFVNEYDADSGTYNYGDQTGLDATQYSDAVAANNSGGSENSDSFLGNLADGSNLGSAVSGGSNNAATEGEIFGGDDTSRITGATAGGSPAGGTTGGNTGSTSGGGGAPAQQIITQQIDTSDLAKSAAMDTGFANVMRDTGNILSDTGNILADTGQINTNVTQGFADVGGQLTGLGTQIGNNQTALTGQIGDLSGNVTEGFANTSNALDTGFAGVNTNLNTQFDTQNQNLTDMSANILGGQTSLQDYLEGMSGRADTYYGGLSEGQSNIMGEVGGLQSGLTDFRNTYDDNTTMANQTRNQLVDQVTGGFNAQDQARAEYNTAAQKERADIAATIGQQQQMAANAPVSYSPALRSIAAGNGPTTTQESTQQSDARNRITAVKNLIGTVGQNLDPALRSQYETLASSFDNNGRLIPVSQDNVGNTTQRALDNQSNLLTTTINTQNQVVDQKAVNVDQLLSYMDQLGYAGNQGTGQLTSSCLMGPTINTFG